MGVNHACTHDLTVSNPHLEGALVKATFLDKVYYDKTENEQLIW